MAPPSGHADDRAPSAASTADRETRCNWTSW